MDNIVQTLINFAGVGQMGSPKGDQFMPKTSQLTEKMTQETVNKVNQ